MDDRAQAALLLAFGGVALRLGLTDAALAYVKASLQPWLAVAGVVLVVIGGSTLVRDLFRPAAAAEEGHDHGIAIDDGHGHGAHGPAVGLLLLLPLLALLLVAPPPLGAFAAARQSSAPPAPSPSQAADYGFLPEPVDGAVELTLSDYSYRALYDTQESLTDARVRLVGFVTPVEDGDGYFLTRFTLNCCAADGTAVKVVVAGDDVPRSPDTWLEIEGTWQPGPARRPGEVATEPAVIVAQQVTEIPQPEQPYES